MTIKVWNAGEAVLHGDLNTNFATMLPVIAGPVNVFGESETGHNANLRYATTDPGGHATADNSAVCISYVPVGSGVVGPVCGDYGLTVSAIKHNWATSTVRGEVDAITVITRNGKDDTAGILANCGTIDGFTCIMEGVSSLFAAGGMSILKQIDVQLAGIESGATGTADQSGAALTASVGTCATGLVIQGLTGSSPGVWTDFIKCSHPTNGVKFSVDGSGNVMVAGTLTVGGIETTAGNIVAGGDVLAINVAASGNVSVAGHLNLAFHTAPATASATGTAGDVAWDSGFIYLCVGANTWKRAAIATW